LVRNWLDREVLGYTLGQPDFRRLWGDSIANGFGMSGEQVVLSLLVFQVTSSSAWVGIALALYFAPSLLVGALAGAIADWMDRRNIIRYTELGISIAMLAFGLLLWSTEPALGALLIIAIISGLLRALYAPARLSYAYDLVGSERSVGGLSMLNLGFRIGQLIGAIAVGLLVQHLTAFHAYLALAGAHGIGFLLLVGLRATGDAAEIDQAPLLNNLQVLGKELRNNLNLLVVMLVMVAVGILGFSYVTVLPELATQSLGAGAQALGIMYAARAGGGLIGVILLTAVGLTYRHGLLLIGTILLFGLGVLLIGSTNVFTIILLALAFTAAISAIYDVLTQSVMQRIVPNHLRGRAMGIWVFVIGIEPLGHIFIGVAAGLIGVAGALQLNGAGLLLVGFVVLFFSPRLRRL